MKPTTWAYLLLVCLNLGGMALAGCAGPAVAVDSPTDEASVARRLYIAKCAKCHKFYDPAKYSDAEWHKWMLKMSRKSKLTPEQEEMLSRYIEDTFRSPRKADAH